MFMATGRQPRERIDWQEITHVRLVPHRQPDSPHALQRRDQLRKLADKDHLVPIEVALAYLEPVRTLDGDREKAIKSDLRNWSNPTGHGNNSKDKGWLQLGRVVD
jgi:hypothetical protein